MKELNRRQFLKGAVRCWQRAPCRKSGKGGARAGSGMENFTFAHISDSHITVPRKEHQSATGIAALSGQSPRQTS